MDNWAKDNSGKKAHVLLCVDILTKWVTYMLFIESRFCDGEDKKTVWYRYDRLIYTGIALVNISIENYPSEMNQCVSIERVTNDFWLVIQQLKEKIVEELSKKELLDEYEFPIHEKMYDKLASQEEIDLGVKRDWVHFIKKLSEISNQMF